MARRLVPDTPDDRRGDRDAPLPFERQLDGGQVRRAAGSREWRCRDPRLTPLATPLRIDGA